MFGKRLTNAIVACG